MFSQGDGRLIAQPPVTSSLAAFSSTVFLLSLFPKACLSFRNLLYSFLILLFVYALFFFSFCCIFSFVVVSVEAWQLLIPELWSPKSAECALFSQRKQSLDIVFFYETGLVSYWDPISPRIEECGHRWNDTEKGEKTEIPGEVRWQCHFVHHNSHIYWPEIEFRRRRLNV